MRIYIGHNCEDGGGIVFHSSTDGSTLVYNYFDQKPIGDITKHALFQQYVTSKQTKWFACEILPYGYIDVDTQGYNVYTVLNDLQNTLEDESN